ncbi:MAG: type II secretion system protein [Phycisphaerae bacterium]|nr:type II secretion system protein [Phycisphaerae bacterium]
MRKKAFTMIELLTVLGIIAILVGILIPALAMVRKFAKETAQKSRFTAIEMAMLTFKNDYGDYPPSYRVYQPQPSLSTLDYCGTQKLAEALVGLDLLGFHPDSVFRSDGFDGPAPSGVNIYTTATYDDGERKGPYLDIEKANVFRLGTSDITKQDGLWNRNDCTPLNPDTFVLCDVFTCKKVVMTDFGKTVVRQAGTPILYYKANTTNKSIGVDLAIPDRIYDYRDNIPFTEVLPILATGKKVKHKIGQPQEGVPTEKNFYYFIADPLTSISTKMPYNPDSYILISAGMDGEYGTADDITNFNK